MSRPFPKGTRAGFTQHSCMSAGFTLIELMVAIGLFAVVMTMASGAYLVMINLNQRAQAVALASDNLSFAFETMMRTIRTGTNYSSCGGPGDCVNGTSFTVTDSSGQTITYTFVAPVGSAGGSILETTNGTSFNLTDSSVNITSGTFILSGAVGTAGGDYRQPMVRIFIIGTIATTKGQIIPFTTETAATERAIDL